LLRQKSTKKGAPKTKRPVFGLGSLIKLLCYCGELHLFLDHHFMLKLKYFFSMIWI